MVLGFTGFLSNLVIGVLSIVFLVISAEIVVSKMEGVAKYYGISEVVIAMTIVSIGTSLPELALNMVGSFNILSSSGAPLDLFATDLSTMAIGNHSANTQALVEQGRITAEAASNSTQVYQNTSGTVLGANIGSDVVQETLVLGLVIISSAFLAGKNSFKFSRKLLIRDYAPMMGTTLMTWFLALNWKGLFNFISGGELYVSGTLTRLDGFILLGSFVAYTYYLYTTRKEDLAEQGDVDASKNPVYDFLIGLVAMAGVIVSAEVFLRVVEVAVTETGISGSMIGVASVGVVSAFPEMITAISGLRRGSEGISLGTLIGSNITNPLFAIGSGALVSTYAVPRPLILWDLPMETILSAVLLVYLFSKEQVATKLAVPFRFIGLYGIAERLESAENRVLSIAGAFLLIVLYAVYLYVRFTYFQYDFVN